MSFNMFHIRALQEYLNLRNKTNKFIRIKHVLRAYKLIFRSYHIYLNYAIFLLSTQVLLIYLYSFQHSKPINCAAEIASLNAQNSIIFCDFLNSESNVFHGNLKHTFLSTRRL
jgi:hypothetical protein